MKSVKLSAIDGFIKIVEQALLAKWNRNLTELELILLRGSLAGQNYVEMARDSGGRYQANYLKGDAGPKFWKLLSEIFGEEVNKRNFLSFVGKKLPADSSQVQKSSSFAGIKYQDWGDAPDASMFFGREDELKNLNKWIQEDKCRVVVIAGMGGIGKTTLAVKIANEIKESFDCIFWRSLLNSPPATKFLSDLISFISGGSKTISDNYDDQILALVDLLKQEDKRYLIVLDNLETILHKKNIGDYSDENDLSLYGDIFKKIATISHNSCLILTSREIPKNLHQLEGQERFVRFCRIEPLNADDVKNIFGKISHFSINEVDDWETLVDSYSGNPLLLELAAHHILEIFQGNISKFLASESSFSDVKEVLGWYFDRISNEELEVLCWLAINREIVTIESLKEDLLSPDSKARLASTIQALQKRSLLQKQNYGFKLQPVILEYTTDLLIENICHEIIEHESVERKFREIVMNDGDDRQFQALNNFALLKATSQDYIKDVQRKEILKPIRERLMYSLGSENKFKERLKEIVEINRGQHPLTIGYLGGSIINLLLDLNQNLIAWDFSNLNIMQADFKEATLHDVNLSNCWIEKISFKEILGRVLTVAFHPNGKYFACGDADGYLRLWNADSYEQIWSASIHSDWISSIAFNNAGDVLASGSEDHFIYLFDLRNIKEVKICLPIDTKKSVWAVKFNLNNILAYGCDDGKIGLLAVNWDQNGQLKVEELKPLEIKNEHHRIRSLSFSKEGDLLASISHDSAIYLWRLNNREFFYLNKDRSYLISSQISCSLCLSPSSSYLISGSSDNQVKKWEINSQNNFKQADSRNLFSHRDSIRCVSISSDERFIASCSEDGAINIWDIQNKKLRSSYKYHKNIISSIDFSPDSQKLISGSHDQSIKVWNVDDFVCLQSLTGYSNWVRSISSNPVRPIIAIGSDDSIIRLWDIFTGIPSTLSINGCKGTIWTISFHPDGELLASSGEDRIIRIWNIDTGQCISQLTGHEDWIWSVAFSPNRYLIASASDDQTIKLWDFGSGECLETLKGHNDWVHSIAFSPKNPNILASGAEDGTLIIWDLNAENEKEKLFSRYKEHRTAIKSLAFNRDGQILASASKDKTIKFWNSTTGKLLPVTLQLDDFIWSITFISIEDRSQYLVCSCSNNIVKWWDIKVDGTLESISIQVTAQDFDYNIKRENDLAPVNFSFRFKTLAIANDNKIDLYDLTHKKWLPSLEIEKPYKGLNISGTNLSSSVKTSLKQLGAVDEEVMTTPNIQKTPEVKIAELRATRKLSQEELASSIYVTVATIANWESGRRGLDMIKNFVHLHTILECTLSELVPRADRADPLLKLRELRETKGMTTADLAEQLQVSEASVTNWEAEKVDPDYWIFKLARLCLALDCKPSDLLVE